MRESAPLPLTFRPSRWFIGVGFAIGTVCAAAAAYSMWQYALTGASIRIGAAGLLGAPCILAVLLSRRNIIVDAVGLHVESILRTRTIAWKQVLAVEQTRRSFVIITEQGDVSAGWIAADRRDLLFRKVLELARLTLEPREQRWGIAARYLRMQAPDLISAEELARSRKSPEDKQS